MRPASRSSVRPPSANDADGQSGGDIRETARAQSELIGVVLLFGLVVAGTAAVVALGGVAIDDAKSQSAFDRTEQVMTLFDSRAATVALERASASAWASLLFSPAEAAAATMHVALACMQPSGMD